MNEESKTVLPSERILAIRAAMKVVFPVPPVKLSEKTIDLADQRSKSNYLLL